MTGTERFHGLNHQVSIEEQELSSFFDSLEPASCERILSRWRGGGFDTGHWLLPALVEMRWFGKWFVSPSDVKPLVCWNEAGELFSSQAMNGEASLAMIEYRGKVSAAVIYDGVPMCGHLRRVDDDILLGMVSGKALGESELVPGGAHQFFFLERIDAWPVSYLE